MQHRATRLVPGIKRKSYESRIKTLKLAILETRRKKGDLIQFCKILNKMDYVNWKNELVEKTRWAETGPAGNMRGEEKSFHKESGKISNIRENFFINRTIALWNDLPVYVKEAGTPDSFKAGLDKLKLFDA